MAESPPCEKLMVVCVQSSPATQILSLVGSWWTYLLHYWHSITWPTAKHYKTVLFSGKEWRTSSGSALLTSNDNESTRPILGPSQVKLPAQPHREDPDIAEAAHSRHQPQPGHGNQISMMLRQIACFSRVTVRKSVSFHTQKMLLTSKQ